MIYIKMEFKKNLLIKILKNKYFKIFVTIILMAIIFSRVNVLESIRLFKNINF
jgi:hypothetical protein